MNWDGSRRSQRIADQVTQTQDDTISKHPTKRKNPPRKSKLAKKQCVMPQIDEPNDKPRNPTRKTRKLMEAVEEEILSEEHYSSDTSLGSPTEPEFLPPYPKPVLPLRDPEKVYTLIENAYQRFSKCEKALRWVRYEYFYSVGDEIYFRHNEFVHTIKMICDTYNDEKEMPIREWRKIRRQMGPPKRLSSSFLRKEREKLHIWRSNSLNVRLGVCDAQYSQLLPPLPQRDMFVLGICTNTKLIRKGILQACANGKFAISFVQGAQQLEFVRKRDLPIDTWSDEDSVMAIRPITRTKRESPEKGPLTTLAIAAEVSPRHNGDVRTLKIVIRLLQKKSRIMRHIEHLHDSAEEMKKSNVAFSQEFQKEYAHLLLQLREIKKELKPQLIRLRASQEKSPFRSLPKRL